MSIIESAMHLTGKGESVEGVDQYQPPKKKGKNKSTSATAATQARACVREESGPKDKIQIREDKRNYRIGGGSPWTKDGTKADLSLNLLARARAVSYIKEHPDCSEVYCAISCRIGSPEILTVFTDRAGNELLSYRESIKSEEVIKEFRLREPRFADMCRKGLFA